MRIKISKKSRLSWDKRTNWYGYRRKYLTECDFKEIFRRNRYFIAYSGFTQLPFRQLLRKLKYNQLLFVLVKPLEQQIAYRFSLPGAMNLYSQHYLLFYYYSQEKHTKTQHQFRQQFLLECIKYRQMHFLWVYLTLCCGHSNDNYADIGIIVIMPSPWLCRIRFVKCCVKAYSVGSIRHNFSVFYDFVMDLWIPAIVLILS